MNKKITIGILISDFYDPYQVEVLEGISEQARMIGIRVIFFLGGGLDNPTDNYKERNELYNFITSQKVDGLLVMSGSLMIAVGKEGLINFLNSYTDIPIISVGIELPGFSSTIVDNESGLYAIISHLIEDHSCKNIAFIKGPDKNDEAIIRFETYKKCLKDHGLSYNEDLICPGNFELGDGVEAVKLLFDKRKVVCDAIIGVDDYAVLNAMELLVQRGFTVPNDIKLCGFDDIDISEVANPPLTTVRQPLYDLGAISVNILIEKINGNQTNTTTMIPTYPIIRKSCGCSLDSIFNFSVPEQTINKSITGKLKEDVIEKTIRNFKTKDSSQQQFELIKTITTLCNAFFNSLEHQSVQICFNVIKHIYKENSKKGLSASFWENILSSIIKHIKIKELSTKNIIFILQLFNEINTYLYKTEMSYKTYKTDFANDVNLRLIDNLVTCYSTDEIKKIINSNLVYVNIHDCLIAFFEESPEKARILYCLSNSKEVDFNDRVISTKELYPQELSEYDKTSLVVLPLLSESTLTGYMIIELKGFKPFIYESFADKVANAIMNAGMLTKIKKHTEELEEEVARRTNELQTANSLLQEQSYRDQLTGLYNRHFLMKEILPKLKAYIEETDILNKPLNDHVNRVGIGLVMLDIDHFKAINDNYGHAAGDKVLTQFSTILKKHTRVNDYIIRMGGEEFLIVLRECVQNKLPKIAEQIRTTVENHSFLIDNKHAIKTTTSLGVIPFPGNPANPWDLDLLASISLADKALYHAKNSGRNKSIIITFNSTCFNDDTTLQMILHSFNNAQEKGCIKLVDVTEKKDTT